jgi:mRNA interferase MazF
MIVSPRSYNARSGLAIAAAITSHVKDYPFEVRLPFGSEVEGVILADQIRTFDWQARKVAKISSLPPGIVSEVLGKLETLVGRL